MTNLLLFLIFITLIGAWPFVGVIALILAGLVAVIWVGIFGIKTIVFIWQKIADKLTPEIKADLVKNLSIIFGILVMSATIYFIKQVNNNDDISPNNQQDISTQPIDKTGYTLEQLQQMGAKPIKQSQPLSDQQNIIQSASDGQFGETIFCNGIDYAKCPEDTKFICPATGEAFCSSPDTTLCNGKYWSGCEKGYKFYCPTEGDAQCLPTN